jgi:hypothetical protein
MGDNPLMFQTDGLISLLGYSCKYCSSLLNNYLLFVHFHKINLKGDNPLMFHNDRLIYRYIKFDLDSCNRIDENIDGVAEFHFLLHSPSQIVNKRSYCITHCIIRFILV